MVGELTINDRWTVGTRLGGGTFGEVHSGTDKLTNEKVAIKLEKLFGSENRLATEYKVYKKFGLSGQYFPRILYYGTTDSYNVMVMQILGPSLEDLFQMCGRKFSIKTITMLGLQMLKRLRHIHRSDYVHRDIKPDNFCIGTGAMDGNVFAVDFGLAKRFKDHDRRHIEERTGKGMMGTARYASIWAHEGYEQSRRDDLEALGYVLAYFYRGSLPWQGYNCKDKYTKYQMIREKKQTVPIEALFKGMPKQFIQFFKHVDELSFKQKPDYDNLEKLFMAALEENGFKNDNQFDWMNNARYKLVKITRLPRPPPPIIPAKPAEKKKRKTKSQRKREARAAGIPIPMKPKYISKAVREKLGITLKHVPRGTTLADLQLNGSKPDQPDGNDTPMAEQPDANNAPAPEQQDGNDTPMAEQPDANNAPVPGKQDGNDTPMAEHPNANDAPMAEQPDANDAPAPEQPNANDAPMAEQLDANNAPVPEQQDGNDTPMAEHPNANDAPAPEHPNANDAPMAEHSNANDAPVPEQPENANNAPAPEQQDGNDTPMAEHPNANNAPMAEQPDANNVPVLEQPDANNAPAPEQPDANDPPVPEQPNANDGSVPEQPNANDGSVPERPDGNDAPMVEQPDTSDVQCKNLKPDTEGAV